MFTKRCSDMRTVRSSILSLLTIATAQFFLTGCSHSYVSSRVYPYTRKDLASYHLDTPDPVKATMLPTQVIAIDWKLPLSALRKGTDQYKLVAFIRYQDETEKQVEIPVTSIFGKTRIEIDPQEANGSPKGGIKSYKILLMRNSEVIAQSRHKLWEDKIKIEE